MKIDPHGTSVIGDVLLPLELVTTSPISQFMIVVLFTLSFCGHSYESVRFNETIGTSRC